MKNRIIIFAINIFFVTSNSAMYEPGNTAYPIPQEKLERASRELRLSKAAQRIFDPLRIDLRWVAPTDNKKVIILGCDTSNPSQVKVVCIRMNEDGTLDESFGPPGCKGWSKSTLGLSEYPSAFDSFDLEKARKFIIHSEVAMAGSPNQDQYQYVHRWVEYDIDGKYKIREMLKFKDKEYYSYEELLRDW